MKKVVIFYLICIVLVGLNAKMSMSLDVGSNNEGVGVVVTLPDTLINYSTIATVNSSDFWNNWDEEGEMLAYNRSKTVKFNGDAVFNRSINITSEKSGTDAKTYINFVRGDNSLTGFIGDSSSTSVDFYVRAVQNDLCLGDDSSDCVIKLDAGNVVFENYDWLATNRSQDVSFGGIVDIKEPVGASILNITSNGNLASVYLSREITGVQSYKLYAGSSDESFRIKDEDVGIDRFILQNTGNIIHTGTTNLSGDTIVEGDLSVTNQNKIVGSGSSASNYIQMWYDDAVGQKLQSSQNKIFFFGPTVEMAEITTLVLQNDPVAGGLHEVGIDDRINLEFNTVGNIARLKSVYALDIMAGGNTINLSENTIVEGDLDVFSTTPTLGLYETDTTKQWDVRVVGSDLQFSEVGADIRMVVETGGNVGIGDVTPLTLLDVGGVGFNVATVGIKCASNHRGISLEENSGVESWQIGVDADGNLNFIDSASTTPVKFEDGTGNVNVTGNITSENVFYPQYIYSHTNRTQPVKAVNVWTNLTFDQEVADIKFGISHTSTDNTNDTFTVMEDGVYEVDYDYDVEDTSAGASDIDIAGRVINSSGDEIIGSVFESGIARNGVEAELSHDFLIECLAGESFKFQFVADDGDVQISSHHTFGDHPESATVVIKKIANLP